MQSITKRISGNLGKMSDRQMNLRCHRLDLSQTEIKSSQAPFAHFRTLSRWLVSKDWFPCWPESFAAHLHRFSRHLLGSLAWSRTTRRPSQDKLFCILEFLVWGYCQCSSLMRLYTKQKILLSCDMEEGASAAETLLSFDGFLACSKLWASTNSTTRSIHPQCSMGAIRLASIVTWYCKQESVRWTAAVAAIFSMPLFLYLSCVLSLTAKNHFLVACGMQIK